ncbi:39S ribosomal protein L3, mitochondrial [Eumeta japonica]|uniref:Large ribosomal subunit protein uL3m n=1 Tax=Eumeta variegata TaxID=151549 RepID=A0A4C1ZDZ3_EUMVA|nr:39S ribosomal protein L3, mitochondrial [Eumeta japonica]
MTSTSPLANVQINFNAEWNPRTRRVGVIARKIGNYPIWLKNGKKVQTTLLQVIDNHVIKYIPPEEFKPMLIRKPNWREKRTLGCLLVGAETIDPSTVTKDYCGLFNATGMLPKRYLCRFMITPNAALPPGTPLLATHYRVGDYLDIRAKTIDRGFQGVMKRWGFKGMPASHGVTKTHRRPGNIGSGGGKARVWPGTKMPGHMGNSTKAGSKIEIAGSEIEWKFATRIEIENENKMKKIKCVIKIRISEGKKMQTDTSTRVWRTLRGVKILRIDTKHNVLWTLGVAIPGETGAMCYLFDTVLPLRRHKEPPPFPTHPPSADLPIEYIHESVHDFSDPTITFEDN